MHGITQKQFVESITGGKQRPGKKVMRKVLVEALKSGQFRQTCSTLCRVDNATRHRSYCCLGVACKVAQLAGYPVTERRSGDVVVFGLHDAECGALLPKTIQEIYGFMDNAGPFEKDSGANTALTELNDNGKSFKEIAKVIESEPAGLFN